MKAIHWHTIDYLNDSVTQILIKLGSPIMLSTVVAVFATLINNYVLKSYCGEYFVVTSVLSALIGLISSIPGSVVSAGWAKYSASIVAKDNDAGKNLVTVFYLLCFLQIVIAAIFLVFADRILHWLNTPPEVYDTVRVYFVVYLIAYFFVGLSTWMVTMTTGLESPRGILVINLVNILAPSVMVAILLGILRLGIVGAAVFTGAAAFLVIGFAGLMLVRHHLIVLPRGKDFRLDFRACLVLLRMSSIVFLQSLICTVGYLVVSTQTNRYLSIDYITVLSVSVPIVNGLSVFSTVITIAAPLNYLSGRFARTKKMMWATFWACEIYGILCFLFHALFGRVYYASLFSDSNVILLGSEYWFLYGLGMLAVPVLYTIRCFFVSVQRVGTALFAGVFELLGNLICAYVLIPRFGNVGRSVAYPLGWLLAAAYLFVAYWLMRKRIYSSDPERIVPVERGEMKNEKSE